MVIYITIQSYIELEHVAFLESWHPFAWREDPRKEFNLHPVLMIVGFVYCMGQGKFCLLFLDVPDCQFILVLLKKINNNKILTLFQQC